MTDITTRYTKGSELTHQQLDEHVAYENVDYSASELTLAAAHNRTHIICNSGVDTIELTATATLSTALDDYALNSPIGWQCMVSNNSGGDIVVNGDGVQFNGGTDTFTLSDNSSIIVGFDNVSTPKGYFIVSEYDSQGTSSYLTGVTPGTAAPSKALVLDASKGIATITQLIAANIYGSLNGPLTGNVTGNLDGIVGGTTPAAGTFTSVSTDTVAEKTGAAGVTVDGLKIKDAGIVLGSDANGDIYYRASGALARLAKGTAGQVLSMNAGATAPEWTTSSSGGRTLLETFSGTGTTTLGENTSVPAGATEIIVVFNGVSMNNGDTVAVQLGDATGYAASGSIVYSYTAGTGSDQSVVAAKNTSGPAIVGYTYGASNSLYGQITLHKTEATGLWTYEASTIDYTDAIMFKSTGVITNGVTVTKIKVTSGAGSKTFDAGAAYVYYR